MRNITVIETESVERNYGFEGTIAVIDHDTHGRLLIVDGYGGERELRGGAVRWAHGSVFKLQPEDTLESLENEGWNDHLTLLQAVQASCDPSRPPLDWTGHMVESVAKRAGI